MRYECYFCHTRTVENLIQKFKPSHHIAEEFVFRINELLGENRSLANPYLSTLIHRISKEMINNGDLFKEEKVNANAVLLDEYALWKEMVDKSNNPLFLSAKLAVAGNIVDYGAHCVPEDVNAQINSIIKKEFVIDDTPSLFQEIKKVKNILYLGDNAGEIVFDRLFIETINHPDLTYVVRGKPVINDVTFEDAASTGINGLCEVISNGYDAPSTLLEHCSDEFLEKFHNAELIISKGQGNFEGLMNCGKSNIFFMLMAKCKPMAELLGVNKGDLVVKKAAVS